MQNLANLSREQLEALVANMAKAQERKLSLKVSAKGAVSLYGLGQFPVTLYSTQWDRVLAHAADIGAFIDANRALLAVKGEPRAAA